MHVAVTLLGDAEHHVVIGAGSDVMLAEIAAAVSDATDEQIGRLFMKGQRLDQSASARDIGLREGSVLTTGDAAPARPELPYILELRVVSGLGACAIIPLAPGVYGIGSAAGNAIR